MNTRFHRILWLLVFGILPTAFARNPVELHGYVASKTVDCLNPECHGHEPNYYLHDDATGERVHLKGYENQLRGIDPRQKVRIRGMRKENAADAAKNRKTGKPTIAGSAESGADIEVQQIDLLPVVEEAAAGEPPVAYGANTLTMLSTLLVFISTNTHACMTTETNARNRLFNNPTNANLGMQAITKGRYGLQLGNGTGVPQDHVINLTLNVNSADHSSDTIETLALNKLFVDSVASGGLGLNRLAWNRILLFAPGGITDSSFTAYAYYPGGTNTTHGLVSVYGSSYGNSRMNGYLHELGHNFGFAHSSTSGAEYGDRTCVMGVSNDGTRTETYNVAKLLETNWLDVFPNAQRSVTTDTTINLYPLSSDPNTVNEVIAVDFPGTDYYAAYHREELPYALLTQAGDKDKVFLYTRSSGSNVRSFQVANIAAGGSSTGPGIVYFERYGPGNAYATVSFDMADGNAKPVANAQSMGVSMNTNQSIILSGSDGDGDSLSYEVVTSPANGMLSGTAPNLSYSPNTNYLGADSFVFKVNDGKISSFATISLTVQNFNTAPVANNQSVNAFYQTPEPIFLTGSDAESQPLTYSVVAGPANGVLSGTPPNLTYTPNNGFSGNDSFTFKANDGQVDSNTATVSIAVSATPNTPPSVEAGPNQNVNLQSPAAIAGLYYGTASGDINTGTPNPKSQILVNPSTQTENTIATNTTEIYTGYIYDADGQISFTEHIDDRARIWIDGNLVLSDDDWSTRTSTNNLNLAPGWHRIEIRISNASGGSGPTSGIGIGYDPAGGTSWRVLTDPGNGTFLRTNDPTAFAQVTLNGTSVTDPEQSPAYVWSNTGTGSGTGPVTFSNVNALSPTVTFTETGIYVLRLTANDGYVQIHDQVTITVSAPTNNPPVTNAGADQTVYMGASTPWLPSQLNPQAWYDADDSTTVIQSGGVVSEWRDKTSNNRHATQSSVGNRPTVVANAMNTLNVINLNGSNQFLNLNLDYLAGVSHSAFIVTRATSYNNIYGAANGSAGASSLHVGFYSSSYYRMNYWGDDWNGAIGSQFNLSGGNVLNFVWQPTVSKEIFANGSSQGSTTNAGTIASLSLAGGGRIGNIVGQGYYGGDIAEMVFITGTVSQANRQNMEGYLAHKWGLKSRLPSGHPYAAAPPGGAGATATLNGSVTDNEQTPIGTWSKVSGPGTVIFSNLNTLNATATFSKTGTYVLRLTGNDGTQSTTDDVTITVMAGSDTTPPTLASTDIVDNRSGAAIVANNPVTYTITFSEDMDASTVTSADFSNAGTSSITFGTITETSPGVFTVQVTPTSAGTLRLRVSSGAVIKDVAGNALVTTSAITDDTTITVTTPDISPTIATLSPANNASGVVISSNLSITFSEAVAFGTGNITLRQSSGALIESFDVSGPAAGLSLSGATVTINPTANLSLSTGYYVEIAATAIDDLTGNSFAGFSGSSTWSFTTESGDVTPPTISSLSPINGATAVSTTSNLTITFSENVAFGTGAISLRQSGGTLIESFDVSGPATGLSLSGATVTINPTANLSPTTAYYVEIAATAIDDLAGNSFAGYSGSSTWSFTTAGTTSSGVRLINTYPTGSTSNIVVTASTETNANNAAKLTVVTNNNGGAVDFDPGVLDDPTDGTETTATQAAWRGTATSLATVAEEWIQWDLGASYTLGAIRVWNYNDSSRYASGIRKLDIYVSNVANPGDPEGAGAANWTLWAANATFPAANGLSTYTGFDLAGAVGASLPSTPIRYVRFEVNSTFIGDGINVGGGTLGGQNASLSQIEFFEVTAPPAQNYNAWISGFSGLNGLTAFNDDPDGDGIKNGIENYFGTHPGESSQGVVMGSVSGNTLTFSHPLNATHASDIAAAYRWSKNLSTFHADGATFEGTTVTFTQGTPVNGVVTVTATITGTMPERIFVDLEVTLP